MIDNDRNASVQAYTPAFFRWLIKHLSLKQKEVAFKMGLSTSTFSDILHRSIDPDMAFRILIAISAVLDSKQKYINYSNTAVDMILSKVTHKQLHIPSQPSAPVGVDYNLINEADQACQDEYLYERFVEMQTEEPHPTGASWNSEEERWEIYY